MDIFNKLKFLLKKPKIIIVTGDSRLLASEAIRRVLEQYFKIGKEVLIFESGLDKPGDIEKFKFLIKKSSLPILVVTQVGDIPPEQLFFAGPREKTAEIRKLAKLLPSWGYLVLNFDDETVREIKDITNLREITFGFQSGADFRATDIKLNRGTNFKIDYKGNIVPVWLEGVFGKEQIYSALSAAIIGVILNLNLVEVSQALKSYHSLPGKMRLIKGIKNSWILDNSKSSSVNARAEALKILARLKGFKKKIAVLGDIIGIGKYAIEAHEAMGERVFEAADLLFTFGLRARFIGKAALDKGMSPTKIFQFDTVEQGKIKLQNEIKEGDLILVDGSKEMKMSDVIKEIMFLDKI